MTQHRRLFGFLACLVMVSSAKEVWGQTPSAAKLYEQGVNAYFAGQSSQAEQFLSEAIQWNPQDPRAYYFRALSLLRQGRTDEARVDMQVGASMEMQTPRRFAVGSALERVQGSSRLMLEQYRRSARRDAVVQASATAAAAPLPVMAPPSTFATPDADAAVLRERRVVPLDELLRPGEPKAVVVPEATAMPVPPQASPATPSVATPQPATPSPAPATPATAPGKNPFEDDAAKSAAEPPAAAPAAAPLTPPQPASSQPAPASQPPAKAPAENEENPFGT